MVKQVFDTHGQIGYLVADIRLPDLRTAHEEASRTTTSTAMSTDGLTPSKEAASPLVSPATEQQGQVEAIVYQLALLANSIRTRVIA